MIWELFVKIERSTRRLTSFHFIGVIYLFGSSLSYPLDYSFETDINFEHEKMKKVVRLGQSYVELLCATCKIM
jgi:hypothetical protein